MKSQWITAAFLSSAIAVGCGGRGTEDTQNAQENEGTSVALAPETEDQAPPQPAEIDQPAASSNLDTTRQPSTGARTPAATRAPATPRTEARRDIAPPPAERVEREAPRASAAPARPTVRTVTLPAGTDLPLELTSAVSTETARVEMPVSARLRRAVTVDGVTVLPAGAIVNGEVIDVDRPGRVQGRARLGLRFTSVTVGGRREDIRTNPVMFEGEATKGEDATKIGAGAGIGAVIGGIVGGGDGAAKGAAIGGAAGTGAVLATRGRDVELAAGSDVNATLASAADFEVR